MIRAAKPVARRLGAALGLMLGGCAEGNADPEVRGRADAAAHDAAVGACVEFDCGPSATWDPLSCACKPSCEGGACGAVSGSCNPEFCPTASQGVRCCYTPNGPCGEDVGFGCGQPRPTGTCDPTFCPASRRGVPCCLDPAGPCGVDEGAGCVGDTPATSSGDSGVREGGR